MMDHYSILANDVANMLNRDKFTKGKWQDYVDKLDGDQENVEKYSKHTFLIIKK